MHGYVSLRKGLPTISPNKNNMPEDDGDSSSDISVKERSRSKLTPDINAGKLGVEIKSPSRVSRETELPSGDIYIADQRIFTNASTDSEKSQKGAKAQNQ